MEETEVIIVGQGLAGSWLGWWLHQAGVSFQIIDMPDPNSASRRAAGLINPITGRRLVTTWMIEELIPFAWDAYQQLGDFLGDNFISEISVIDFFPTVQMVQAFQKRYKEDPTWLRTGDEQEKYSKWFRNDFGWGAIQPCLLVQVEKLLLSFRGWLKMQNCLKEEKFDFTQLRQEDDGIFYSGTHARKIIFCDGQSSSQNPYFEKLPFALNKGEGLLVEIDGLPTGLVFKKGMSLVPYSENVFWLGSTYEWEFSDDQPSEKFRNNAENWLRQFMIGPYKIIDHFAAVRPATLERRPFVGFHPNHPQIGILNGLGTKGCSLAPYFAKQLAGLIRGTQKVDPLAEISRFKRVLER